LVQSSTPTSTNGKIQVRPDFGYYMDQLHNVSNTAAVTNDILVYNSSNVWTPTNNATLNNVSANLFSGNGSGLTDLTGANVTGIVANANYAAYAGNVESNNVNNVASNTQVLYSNVGKIAGSNAFTFNNTTNSVAISNALTVTGNVTISGQLTFDGNVVPDIRGVDDSAIGNARNLNFTTGSTSEANGSASGTAGGNFVNSAGNATNANANALWNASGGGALNFGGTAISANGNATGGQVSFTAGAGNTSTGAGIGTGGSVNFTGGLGNSNTGNSFGGTLNFTGGAANTQVGRAQAGNIRITSGTVRALGAGGNAVTAGDIQIVGGIANGNSNSATTSTILLRTGSALARTSGTATTGNIDLQVGAANGVTSNVVGSINIGSQAANTVIGAPSNINIGQTNTPTFVGGNLNIGNAIVYQNGVATFTDIIITSANVSGSNIDLYANGLIDTIGNVNSNNINVGSGNIDLYANGEINSTGLITTTANVVGNNFNATTFVVLSAKTAANLANTTGTAGAMISVSDQDHQPAYWSTVDSVWKYVSNRANV